MIVIMLVLVVGMLFGAVLADRIFHAGATSASRRALAQLEYTLGGLETAYSMKAASLHARHGLAARVEQPTSPTDEFVEPRVHLPRQHR
jgi:hypothetical protein